MKVMILLSALALSACGVGSSSPEPTPAPPVSDPEPVVTKYATQSSWYELPQYFDGVPKYSGAMGTYTAKHIPVAVSCDIGRFATYSNNQRGELEIHVINLDTKQDVTVRKIDTIDPHQNAAIQCVGDKLHLSISARNLSKPGYDYTSSDGINWELQREHQEAYPQLHNVGSELLKLYTEYDYGNGARVIKSSCNNEPIVDDSVGRYMLSYYDGDRVHVVYNAHYRGSDRRTELWHTQSVDGCEWSESVKWLGGSKYVYLKDLNAVKGELTALVTLSDSFDPTTGSREVVKVTADGVERVMNTSHNYTTGSLMGDGRVLFPDGSNTYAGGEFMGMRYVNYIRRVHGSAEEVVLSEGISAEYKSDAWLVGVTYD